MVQNNFEIALEPILSDVANTVANTQAIANSVVLLMGTYGFLNVASLGLVGEVDVPEPAEIPFPVYPNLSNVHSS